MSDLVSWLAVSIICIGSLTWLLPLLIAEVKVWYLRRLFWRYVLRSTEARDE